MIFGASTNETEDDVIIAKKENGEYWKNIKNYQYNKNPIYKKINTLIDNSNEIHVSILGHSLSVTDSFILKKIITNSNTKSILIYYLDESDFEKKQNNLIEITKNTEILNKIRTFHDQSIRMPQFDDDNILKNKFELFIKNKYKPQIQK